MKKIYMLVIIGCVFIIASSHAQHKLSLTSIGNVKIVGVDSEKYLPAAEAANKLLLAKDLPFDELVELYKTQYAFMQDERRLDELTKTEEQLEKMEKIISSDEKDNPSTAHSYDLMKLKAKIKALQEI